MRLFLFLVGIVGGFMPVLGQIFGLMAWWESRSGNEMEGYLRAFAHGVLFGTVCLVVLVVSRIWW